MHNYIICKSCVFFWQKNTRKPTWAKGRPGPWSSDNSDNKEIIKAAVLLGANEEEASKEMSEVMALMENLVKLTNKHLVFSDFPASWRSMGYSQDMDVQSFMYKKQIVDQNALNKVGDLSEAFPGVRHHHYETNPFSRWTGLLISKR